MSVVKTKLGCAALVGIVVTCVSPTTPVHAFDLVPGGYAAPSQPISQRDSSAMATFPDFGVSGAAPNMALDFTPRSSASLWSLESADQDNNGRLGFDLLITGEPNAAADRLGLGSFGATPYPTQPQRGGGLAIGGAMRWDAWSLGGSYGRAELLGADVDLMAASVGYGRINAQIAYGQSADSETTPVDVLLFSTDLAAWSWLTLESDVAVGADRAKEESVAAGRLGIRLNF